MKQVNETFILLLLTDLIYLGGRRKKNLTFTTFAYIECALKTMAYLLRPLPEGVAPSPTMLLRSIVCLPRIVKIKQKRASIFYGALSRL